MGSNLTRNLRNTLNGNLKPKFEPDDGGFNFGVELEIGGFGISASTENGGTFGVGAGVFGIEIDATGEGNIELLNGVAKMEVIVVGCTRLKETSIGGVVTHVEAELVPNCVPEEPQREPPERDRNANDLAQEQERNFPDNEFGDPFFPGDPEDILMGCAVWNTTDAALDLYGFFSGKLVRPAGGGHLIIEQVSEPKVTGEGYLQYYEVTARRSSYRGYWTTKTDFGGFGHASGDPNWPWAIDKPPDDSPNVRTLKIGRLVSTMGLGRNLLAIFSPGFIYVTKAKRKEFNRFKQSTSRFYSGDNQLKDLISVLDAGDPFDGDVNHAGLTSWSLNIFGVYNLTQGMPEWQTRRKDKPGLIPRYEYKRKNNMGECCFSKQDRNILKLNAIALRSYAFPGIIDVRKKDDGSLDIKSEFPTDRTEIGETETFISNYIDLKIWQTKILVENAGSASVENIEKFLGINQPLIPLGQEEFKPGSEETGFPIEIPDFLNQPRDEKGKYIKDLALYPRKTINSLRELKLYELELQERLYRFSGAGPTLESGYLVPLNLTIPLAEEGKFEELTTLTEILSSATKTTAAFGFPQNIQLSAKTPGGRLPLTFLSSKDFVQALGNLAIETQGKVTRNQVSLTNLSMVGEELHKLIVLIYRLVVLLRKSIGIKWRKVTGKDSLEVTGQETTVQTYSNTTAFFALMKQYDNRKKNNKSKKGKGFDKSDEIELLINNIDARQDFINTHAKINVAAFDTEEETLSLYAELFKDKI